MKKPQSYWLQHGFRGLACILLAGWRLFQWQPMAWRSLVQVYARRQIYTAITEVCCNFNSLPWSSYEPEPKSIALGSASPCCLKQPASSVSQSWSKAMQMSGLFWSDLLCNTCNKQNDGLWPNFFVQGFWGGIIWTFFNKATRTMKQ